MLKRAALLLFHEDPERWFTGAYVKIGMFRSESDLAFHDEVHGDLFTQMEQTVELLRGDRADDAVTELAQLAIARRGEVVAEVGAAAELTDAQRTRLTAVLTRIYHHPVSVQLHVDPALLGGLSVAVADEVIDGTLSSRLSAAETKLPD